MTPAVSARGLGKRFEHRLPRRHSLLGRLRAAWRGEPLRLPVWALRDVSFDVAPGECLGLVGPNGAGKSTLLGLLAGILEPTEGAVTVRGRANTFLRLDAGVHPELSVRENVEICGVLMGLRRRTALARLDAVLDFAEVAELAEVRMAELSSGQAARVMFGTVMHADMDVLLVDEALAVGDRAFQAKCRDAFARLRREGKTLVVVSHDEELLAALGARLARLEAGRLVG